MKAHSALWQKHEERYGKSKEGQSMSDEENSDGSDSPEIPEEMQPYFFAALDGMDAEELPEKERRKYKGPQHMEDRAKQHARKLLKRAADNLKNTDVAQTDNNQKTDDDGPALQDAACAVGGPEGSAEEARGHAASLQRRSDKLWVAPFVPETSLETCRLTTGHREAVEWVARYYADAPDAHNKELKQKTKTATLKRHKSEHSCFVAALKWIWQKHQLCSPGAVQPAHVRSALSPDSCRCHEGKRAAQDECEKQMKLLERNGLLLAKRMTQEAARASDCTPKVVAMSQKTSEATASKDGVDAYEGKRASEAARPWPVTAADSESSQVQAPAEKKHCAPSDVENCWLCSDTHDLSRCPMLFLLPWLTDMPKPPEALRKPEVDSRAARRIHNVSTFLRQKIPPDGNCLFTGAAVGTLACRKNKGKMMEMTADEMQRYGIRNRKEQLSFIAANADMPFPPPDGPKLSIAIEAATGQSVSGYLSAMQNWTSDDSRTWGGCLELEIMAHRWRCSIWLFATKDSDSYELLCCLGTQHSTASMALLWTGVHYDLLWPVKEGAWSKMRSDLTRK